MSLPSSSFWGLTIAVVCCRLLEDVKLLLSCVLALKVACSTIQLCRRVVEGTLGSKKSRDILCRYLRGASCRKARAADVEFDEASCEQLLVIHRVAMFATVWGSIVDTDN